MTADREISLLKECLEELKREGKVLVAVLYGSYAKCVPHGRSDIDLALYLKAKEDRYED
jgi:predicted nucleotidyltransferase